MRYEDFVKGPIAFTENLYKWLGFGPPSPFALEWVAANTRVASGNSYALSRNSSWTAAKWKDQLGRREQDTITKSCSAFFDRVPVALGAL